LSKNKAERSPQDIISRENNATISPSSQRQAAPNSHSRSSKWYQAPNLKRNQVRRHKYYEQHLGAWKLEHGFFPKPTSESNPSSTSTITIPPSASPAQTKSDSQTVIPSAPPEPSSPSPSESPLPASVPTAPPTLVIQRIRRRKLPRLQKVPRNTISPLMHQQPVHRTESPGPSPGPFRSPTAKPSTAPSDEPS
jgi:hypothetical protein